MLVPCGFIGASFLVPGHPWQTLSAPMCLKIGWPTDGFATWGAQVTPKSVQRHPKTAIRLRKWGQKLIQSACRSSFFVFLQNLEIWQPYNDFNGFWRSLEVPGTVKIPIKLWKKWLRLRRDGEVAHFRGKSDKRQWNLCWVTDEFAISPSPPLIMRNGGPRWTTISTRPRIQRDKHWAHTPKNPLFQGVGGFNRNVVNSLHHIMQTNV